MKIIIGDGAYEHLAEWLKEKLKWVLQIFKRSDTAKTPFEVLPSDGKSRGRFLGSFGQEGSPMIAKATPELVRLLF